MTEPDDVPAESVAEGLAGVGVVGLTIAWIDNNGISRSRTVPISRVAEVAERGVGITALFAVFDSHDGITFGYEGLPHRQGMYGWCLCWAA